MVWHVVPGLGCVGFGIAGRGQVRYGMGLDEAERRMQ